MEKRKAKMHHLFGILLSGFLILAMACPAAGHFETNHLIQVVYNEDDSEVAVDLGDLSAIDLLAQDVELCGPSTVSLDQFATISDWSDLRVGYFAVNETTYQNWFATTQDTAPVIAPAQLLSFENGATQVWQKYLENGIAPGVAQVTPPSQPRTYNSVMNLNSTVPGAYAGFNLDDADGESSLDLLSSQGYVDTYLYHYDVTTLDKGPDQSTDYAMVLRIMADGSTVLNPSSGQNQGPIANDDGATTSEDTSVDVNVTANDTDADGTIDGATVSIVTDASNGTTYNNGDGTVTYTPDPGFTGSDAFTYTVQDNEGAVSNEATVTVQVTPESQNQVPIANDDGAATSEDTPVDVNVIANDTDADGTIDGTSVSIVTDAQDGTTFDNGDGTVTYTPAPGFTGTDTFTYTVNDNDGAVSNEATVTVEVTPGSQNQAPIANDDGATTSEDTPVDINVIDNDTDADGTIDGTGLSIVTDAQDGTTFDNGDGTVTYTPDPGFTGSDAFTYKVEDNEGAVSNEATVTVHVVGGGATICAFLGDDPRLYAQDMDVFEFSGTAGEMVTVSLESSPPEYGAGQRAVLIMRSLGHGLRLFKRLNNALPLEMTVILPVSGDYHVKVMEAPGREVIWGEKYQGEYCVTLEASPEICDTFAQAYSVE
ncbi:MAG: cadherin-like domain-containing protein [Thermodesulfobacteriota bacterium]|nr:cadherin-like domain-containing protein [Thermodesulfobacteriota bacterium]